MSRRMNLSLCMITNNDEGYVCDSLRQFKDIADEFIIADIGSTDHTMDIARQEGARVYQINWNNDFSEVRNFCMDHARGRWILFLQPNETISEGHRNEMLSLLDNPNAEAYLMLIDHSSESFRISSPVQAIRLLRNHKENRYRYRSFESIPDEILTGVVNSKIEIVQLYDAMLSWELNLRLTLLQEEAIANPQDSYLQYMMGLIKLNLQFFEESIVCFQNARSNVNPGCLFAPHLYKCLSWAYLFLEQYTGAMETLNEGIEFCPYYADLYILRAEIYKQLGQYENAIQDLEQCLQIRQCPNLSVPAPEISDSYVFVLFGEISEQMLNDIKALSYYMQAYQLDNADIELLYKIGEIIEMTGSEEAIEALLCIAVEQQNPVALAALLDMLQKRHAYNIILSRMNDIISILGDEQAKALEVSCRVMTGDITAESVEPDDCGPEIMLRRIEDCWFRGNWTKAEELLQELEKTNAIDRPMPDLYHIHRLLTGRETVEKALAQDVYGDAISIYSDFIWKRQEGKAKLLLPMLLDGQEDERCIQLALPWTGTGDFEVIRTIFSRISSNERKTVFIQKIIQALLRCEHPDTACKLKSLSGIELPEELDRLLWVSCMIQALREWVTNGINEESNTQPESAPPDMPGQGLADFCRILCSLDGNIDTTKFTKAETHKTIGDQYMKSDKKTEAFSAYLKALQTEPLNNDVQQKAISLLCGDPGLEDLLRKMECEDEDGWFTDKGEFVDFIVGLRDYYNGLFKQALAHFLRPVNDKKTGRLFNEYAAVCSWLDDNKSKTPPEKLRTTADTTRITIHICLDYISTCFRMEYRQCGNLSLLLEEKVHKLKEESGYIVSSFAPPI